MATAERLTVSVPAELAARMREAGISPSTTLQEALTTLLGDGKRKRTSETRLTSLERKVARLERAVGARQSRNGTATDTQQDQ